MSHADLVTLDRAFRAVNIELPQGFQRALAVLTAALSTAAQNPAHGLVEAFEDGSLTPANVGAEVRRAALDLTAQRNAAGLVRDLETPMSKAARRAVRDHGDELVAQLRPIFDGAAAEVATAASLFPSTASASDVLAAGPEAAAAWTALTDHAAVLERVHDARLLLAQCRFAPSPHRVAYFCAGISTQDQMVAATTAYSNSSGRGGRFHALAVAGFALHLNDAREVGAANEAIQADVSALTAGRAQGPRMDAEQQAGAEKELRIRASVPVPVPMKAKARA